MRVTVPLVTSVLPVAWVLSVFSILLFVRQETVKELQALVTRRWSSAGSLGKVTNASKVFAVSPEL